MALSYDGQRHLNLISAIIRGNSLFSKTEVSIVLRICVGVFLFVDQPCECCAQE